MTTIRRRLTVWYTVALGVTVLAFGALLYLDQRQASLRDLDLRLADLDQRLALQANLAEHRLADTYRLGGRVLDTLAGPRKLLPELEADLAALPDYLVVADSGGHLLAMSGAALSLTHEAQVRLVSLFAMGGASRVSGTAPLGAAFGQVRYLAVRLRNAGPDIGAVLVAAPFSPAALAPAVFAPASLLRSMLLIAPLILLSSFIVGYWLARTSLRPLHQITEELEAITDGRSLHRRVAAPSSADELSRLVLTINGMFARLEQSFTSLHRFTADASHELKTPLMVLRAGVERALIHPGMPPEIFQALDDTLDQINRMSEMVESLLTLARADEGRAPLVLEPCDLRDLLADVTETAGILGDEAGIVVVAQFPDHPVEVPVDRDRIREMLLNLVTNAVKYTSAGGTVSLTLADTDQAATLTVRDSGIGIAPGDLAHVFERFWRADPARSRTGNRPGTGLGLAITKWIAEAHGGSITVQSRPGRGTVFTVTLPKPLAVAPAPTAIS